MGSRVQGFGVWDSGRWRPPPPSQKISLTYLEGRGSPKLAGRGVKRQRGMCQAMFHIFRVLALVPLPSSTLEIAVGYRCTGQTEDRSEAEPKKQNRTDKRQETRERHDRQEIRDATDRKRDTRERSQDDRDTERRGAWRVCGWCVWVSSEGRDAEQPPQATAPPHPQSDIDTPLPRPRKRSPTRPNPGSTKKPDFSPDLTVPDQSRSQPATL